MKMIILKIKQLFNNSKKKILEINRTILKRKIHKYLLSGRDMSIPFYKLVLKYIQTQHKKEYVAIGHLKEKIGQSKNHLNPIEYLLPDQQMPLPSFFSNKITCFNIDQCLGIRESDNQQVYVETLNNLTKKTNNLDCNYFISLISEKKPFHYLKYTHGFWDALTRLAIKEYALNNGKDLVMQSHTAFLNHLFNNDFMYDIFQLVNSERFLNMVKSRDIYFCPTTSSGSIGSKIEFKIMNELANKNYLYHYSQIMLINEFSKYKEITSSNIFKKIICTDSLRNVFLNKIKEYDLILICNHRVATKISKIYPYFKDIYCLPDRLQDMKHLTYTSKFARDVCKSVLSRGSTRPALILSQAGVLSTFISYEILNEYENENISLIDVGKPLEILFFPEITPGGEWRDNDKIKHEFHNMSHLISEDLFADLMKDTKIETGYKKFKKNMDIEMASKHRDTLF